MHSVAPGQLKKAVAPLPRQFSSRWSLYVAARGRQRTCITSDRRQSEVGSDHPFQAASGPMHLLSSTAKPLRRICLILPPICRLHMLWSLVWGCLLLSQAQAVCFKLVDNPSSTEHDWIRGFGDPSPFLTTAGYDPADLKEQPFKCCQAALTALARLIIWPRGRSRDATWENFHTCNPDQHYYVSTNRDYWAALGYFTLNSRGYRKYLVRKQSKQKYIQVYLGKPNERSTWGAKDGWVNAHTLLSYIMKGDKNVFHGDKKQGNAYVTMHASKCESSKRDGSCLNPSCLEVGKQSDNMRTRLDRKIKWSPRTNKKRFARTR